MVVNIWLDINSTSINNTYNCGQLLQVLGNTCKGIYCHTQPRLQHKQGGVLVWTSSRSWRIVSERNSQVEIQKMYKNNWWLKHLENFFFGQRSLRWEMLRCHTKCGKKQCLRYNLSSSIKPNSIELKTIINLTHVFVDGHSERKLRYSILANC